MIRAARHIDAPEIEAMVQEMFIASKYLGRGEISPKVLSETVLGMIAGQGQPGPGGSIVSLAEEDGKIIGFMVGMLSRVYFVGNRLEAQDVFLYVRPGSGPGAVLALIDSYVAWAKANRRVIEIKLSWNDALPGAKAIAALYRRKGLSHTGEIYEMRLDLGEAK